MSKKKTNSRKTGTTRRRGRKTKQELEEERRAQEMEEERRQIVTILILCALVIIGYMRWGVVGEVLNNVERFVFGRFYFLLLILAAIQILITIINRRSGNQAKPNPSAIVCLWVALLLLFSYLDTDHTLKGFDILFSYVEDLSIYFSADPPVNVGGGLLGALLLSASTLAVDYTGTIVVIVVLFVIAMILLVNLSVYKQFGHTLAGFFATHQPENEPAGKAPEQVQLFSTEEPEEKSVNASMPVLTPDPEPEPEPEPEPAVPSQPVQEEQGEGWSIPTEKPFGAAEAAASAQPAGTQTSSIFINVADLVDRSAIVSTEQHEREEVDEAYEDTTLDNVQPVTVPGAAVPQKTAEVETGTAKVRKAEPAPSQAPVHPNKPYRLPKVSLLDPIPPRPADHVNEQAADEKGALLINVLHNFGIEAKLIGRSIGPAVTRFEVRPDASVKVSRILNLADDIKMQLAVKDVRIEAPIPGYNAVGIEVPNVAVTPVRMKEVITRIPEAEKDKKLVIALGKDISGKVVTCRLDKMPHLLIAGATGSGKSVCINSIITTLLLRTKPEEVKLLLIDPKKVEFTSYKYIPHLIGPLINDSKQAANALKVMVRIMEDRYKAFADAGVRNMETFNQKVDSMPPTDEEGRPKPKKMPYIVVIIDELADLMNVAGKEVEESIQRLTQLARAAGIHLIVATQRPSVDVITGVIKANIPSRIAFAVSSGIDSRTILEHPGAERLLGNGDMLYQPIGESTPIRVQGVYVTDDEVARIAGFCAEQQRPFYDDAFVRLDEADAADGGVVGVSDDPLFEEVKDFVIQAQKASTSLLQRKFGIGYNRAARMIDQLEQDGVIGPAQGSRPREVYLKPDQAKDES